MCYNSRYYTARKHYGMLRSFVLIIVLKSIFENHSHKATQNLSIPYYWKLTRGNFKKLRVNFFDRYYVVKLILWPLFFVIVLILEP